LSGYPFWYYNNPPSCQATPSGTTTVLPLVRLPLLVLQQSSLLPYYPFWYYNSVVAEGVVWQEGGLL
jgi:hypothetical protein